MWDAVDLGNCPKRESLQKWLGEVAKGLFDSFGTREQKVSQESFSPPQPSFAPVQPHFAPVAEASCLRGPKDLLHPLLTTFGNFHFSGNFPGLQLLNLSGPVLRDTARLSQRYPPIARYGVFGVSTWPIGCDTPSPFSERFPLGEHAKWRCDSPPFKRGISAILARYPIKTIQMGAIPPSAILSRKGIARYGGVSRTGPLSSQPDVNPLMRSMF